ncbi:hypothetical protein ACFY9A_39105 [Streptomyces rubradiris]|uniref:hypothetical protein n=1 Tax=Streptomyces rubradiris TaxID=285531 RepID=UPI0036EAE492
MSESAAVCKAVRACFRYLRAVEAGDTEAAADLADAGPRMPALLVDAAERTSPCAQPLRFLRLLR